MSLRLLFCAGFLDDIERVRIASENRLRSLTQVNDDEDLGLNLDRYSELTEALAKIEHQATLELQRAVKDEPLGPWIKTTTGVGLKQGARLLAAIGDITYNALEGRPRRGPAELWRYCGYAPEQKRRKGHRSNWNHEAKMRAFLIAESCIKQRTSPYRIVYDQARESWAPKDTSDGHKHNHALRVTAKAVLKDMFLEAQRVEA